ncbi:hypothetical protein EBS80_04135 [bacterium]|nr:hypothetical protein [bacterium]
MYYVDADMRRHPFWDTKTFFTWADNWNDVIWVTDATLSTLPIGTAMLPKPGVVLVKIADGASTYAIGTDGSGNPVLRLIPDETTAISLYGTAWADYVIDLEPTVFSKFGTGSTMSGSETVDRSIMKTRAQLAAASI